MNKPITLENMKNLKKGDILNSSSTDYYGRKRFYIVKKITPTQITIDSNWQQSPSTWEKSEFENKIKIYELISISITSKE